jgi:hypothetical protein
MFNIKSLIIVLLFLHSIICLKSIDFCTIKQKECKGVYDTKNNYKTKCNLIKCHGEFKYECSPNICSNNLTECDMFNKWLDYSNTTTSKKAFVRLFDSKNFEQRMKNAKKFELFIDYITNCKKKIYKFDSNDFCDNKIKCNERKKVSNGFGYKYIKIKTECICPTKQSFRCGKYCTTNSNTCDYLMSYFGHIYYFNIKQCSIVQKSK